MKHNADGMDSAGTTLGGGAGGGACGARSGALEGYMQNLCKIFVKTGSLARYLLFLISVVINGLVVLSVLTIDFGSHINRFVYVVKTVYSRVLTAHFFVWGLRFFSLETHFFIPEI